MNSFHEYLHTILYDFINSFLLDITNAFVNVHMDGHVSYLVNLSSAMEGLRRRNDKMAA